jgi:SlyX protein
VRHHRTGHKITEFDRPNHQGNDRMNEERLIDLEARIAHQDESLRELSSELYAQQRSLERLEATCKFLVEQLRTRTDDASAGISSDEKPPHY